MHTAGFSAAAQAVVVIDSAIPQWEPSRRVQPRLALPAARRVAVFSREMQMTKTDAQGAKTGTSPTDSPVLNPGDEAAPGTTGTGEDVCPDCHGKGRIDGAPCATCGGSGTVIRAVGGA